MIFAKITLFFVGSFWVEILRLAHSFGLWGCLGRSKLRQFDKNPMDLTRIPMPGNGFGHNFVHKILSNPSNFHAIDDVSSVPGTPTTQNYAPNEVSRPKSFPRKKICFLQKSLFRRFFHFFRDLKTKKLEI